MTNSSQITTRSPCRTAAKTSASSTFVPTMNALINVGVRVSRMA